MPRLIEVLKWVPDGGFEVISKDRGRLGLANLNFDPKFGKVERTRDVFDLLSCLNHICHFVLAGLGLSNENSSLHSPDRSVKDSPLRSPLAALWPRKVAGYHEEFIVDEFTLSVKEKGDLSFLKSCNSRGVYQKHSRISNEDLKYKVFG